MSSWYWNSGTDMCQTLELFVHHFMIHNNDFLWTINYVNYIIFYTVYGEPSQLVALSLLQIWIHIYMHFFFMHFRQRYLHTVKSECTLKYLLQNQLTFLMAERKSVCWSWNCCLVLRVLSADEREREFTPWIISEKLSFNSAHGCSNSL